MDYARIESGVLLKGGAAASLQSGSALTWRQIRPILRAMGAHENRFCRIDVAGQETRIGGGEARLPWWSFGKTVIAALALVPAEQRALKLDAPIRGRSWTLRQLLGHTAGLPDDGGLDAYRRAVAAGEPAWPREHVMEIALAGGVLFAPGAGRAYSNIGYMLAVAEIERASQRPLSELVATLIVQPLELRSLRLAEPCSAAPPGYVPNSICHGCLLEIAQDAARLLRSLVDGRLIRRVSLQAMQEARPLGGAMQGRPWNTYGYGLGVTCGVMAGAGRAIGHSGGGSSSVCAVYWFPDPDDQPVIAAFVQGGAERAAEAAVAGSARLAPAGPIC